MYRQIGINLFLGIVGLCTIIGVIGCDNFEDLVTEIIGTDPIEPADNEFRSLAVLDFTLVICKNVVLKSRNLTVLDSVVLSTVQPNLRYYT